jgi:hypothetical protein
MLVRNHLLGLAAVRMWEGGPLRQFSETSISGRTQYQSHWRSGFAGRYICDECQKPVVGVTLSKGSSTWCCADCGSRPERQLQTLAKLSSRGASSR